ncbi:DUF5667 domain-containing protein [Caldalkalibacillus mannanilyticus]|uniref:DUF5667 domain-containing protein n=1 Tax=Caldalkalibacillus mannanilyticus TaxID=1418 RepID=UPI000468D436|nr:DUF5667 domain-containing protein [Caldalkalibacillus mannanilyticus]
MTKKRKTNRIATSLLAGVLVFSSSSYALADQSHHEAVEAVTYEESEAVLDTQVEEQLETELEQEQQVEQEIEPEAETEAETETEAELELDEHQKPSLIPGDFFYFVKVMFEKIQVAISSNDYEKAKLLAHFAQERIAEANALIQAGETELAEQTLQEAIAHQERSLQLTEQPADTEQETTDESDLKKELAPLEEAQNGEVNEEILTEEENQQMVDEVRVHLSNNIIALTKVLEKLENPKAQAAIMKNIEKSFAKLEKKIEKQEKRQAKQNTAVSIEADQEEESLELEAIDLEEVEEGKEVIEKSEDATNEVGDQTEPLTNPVVAAKKTSAEKKVEKTEKAKEQRVEKNSQGKEEKGVTFTKRKEARER